MATARLFVALELPAGARAALADWTAHAVSGAVQAARPVPEASLHVTLCFLGSVELGEVGALAAALESVGESVPVAPVVLRAGEVVWLPPRRPRVCALALTDHAGAATALQAAVATRLAAGGWYVPERRRFLAHVTVARMREAARGREARRVPEAAADAPSLSAPSLSAPSLSAPSLSPFAAEAVVLYRSWPGSRYEPLARVALPAAG